MSTTPASPVAPGALEHATKAYGELEAEVIRPGLCTECRACVNLCEAEGLNALELDLGAFTFDESRCTSCGLCYAVCPEVSWSWDDLKGRFHVADSDIGRILKLTSAVTRNAEIREASADGGVATSILMYLLESKHVDGAVLSRAGDPLGPNLFIARSVEDIRQASGLRAGRGATLATGGGLVTNLDTVAFLRELHRQDPTSKERLAVVGTPCQTYTVRRMQQIGVAPADRVDTVIGLFCYEALPLNKVQWRRFEEATGLHVEDVERVQMREELVLTMKDGRTKRIDLDVASLLAGPNCLRCADYSSRLADLSLGAVGSSPGFTTVIVRTERGRSIFDGAKEAGYVAEATELFDSLSPEEVARRVQGRLEEQSRKKTELARQAGTKIRF